MIIMFVRYCVWGLISYGKYFVFWNGLLINLEKMIRWGKEGFLRWWVFGMNMIVEIEKWEFFEYGIVERERGEVRERKRRLEKEEKGYLRSENDDGEKELVMWKVFGLICFWFCLGFGLVLCRKIYFCIYILVGLVCVLNYFIN